jgi:4-hydroxy-4-methyl-2-oxoglutarate aldolase
MLGGLFRTHCLRQRPPAIVPRGQPGISVMSHHISINDYRSAIRQRFLAADSSNVMDVLDSVGRPNQALKADFQPIASTGCKIAGFAYTIRGQMTPYEGTGDPEKMRACNGISEDEVSVWSGDGRGICYFGELIALGMKERGCTGAVVDGGVRDVRWIAMHEFPVVARYRTPVQSIGRWRERRTKFQSTCAVPPRMSSS